MAKLLLFVTSSAPQTAEMFAATSSSFDAHSLRCAGASDCQAVGAPACHAALAA